MGSTITTEQRGICTLPIIIVTHELLADICKFQKGFNQIDPRKAKPVPFLPNDIRQLRKFSKDAYDILVPVSLFSLEAKIYMLGKGIVDQQGISIELGTMRHEDLNQFSIFDEHKWTIQLDQETVLMNMPEQNLEFFVSLRRTKNPRQRKQKTFKDIVVLNPETE